MDRPPAQAARFQAGIVGLGLALVLACDAQRPSVQESVAQAMQFAPPRQPVVEETTKESGPSAREQLEARRRAEVAAAATLPDELPPNLKEACDALVDAYDGFMKSADEKTALRWHYDAERRKKLAAQRAGCIRRGSVEAAACATATLPKALPSLADLDRTDVAARVLLHCATQHPESDRTLAQG